MTQTVTVKPALIRWAISRSGLSEGDLVRAFPKLGEWERGERQPTLRQLEQFAGKTMTPLGYLFLEEPPDEQLPIPDFRTVGDRAIERPSPNLIETIQAMLRRQAWMREYLTEERQPTLQFVGSAENARNIVSLAARMRETLGLNINWAEQHNSWELALRTLRASAERIGVLVATASVVGLNNHRPLDPEEFRGFVLCDEYAPLIFVNGADSKSAQMFTLAHELVHVWVGRGGLFNLIHTLPYDDEIERFSNRTAAEFLVPGQKLQELWEKVKHTGNPFKSIAGRFKVSPVAAARRALDLGLIDSSQFFEFYEQDQKEFHKRKAEERQREKRGGPNFYDVQDLRLGKRFAHAVVRAVREGRLLYREAYQLTDLRGNTFTKYADRLRQRMVNERQ
jgi:Zn-dependent peptidase ImmA (M78 family)